jgi:hypothetical protein
MMSGLRWDRKEENTGGFEVVCFTTDVKIIPIVFIRLIVLLVFLPNK